MTAAPLGVGIVGAGPVVQAIHLPTLARLPELFAVRSIMDVNPEVAAAVAGRVGARPVSSLEELLDDEAVEVVAICSPSSFHAPQAIAAMRAGKRAVLCEKPFATDREQAAQIAEVSRETGVPVVVGAMHTFDPAWLAVAKEWGALESEAHTIRSRVVLPPNARFESAATEVLTARPDLGPADLSNPEVRAGMVTGGVLGLAIHDLPLIRRFLPSGGGGGGGGGADDGVRVVSASALSPWGYEIGFTSGGRLVQLIGALTEQWRPRWELEVLSESARLHVEFTPSYVHAGSAVATWETAGRSVRLGPFDHNGYEGEWRAVHRIASGERDSAPALATLIDDLVFAVGIAADAAALAREDGPR